MILLPKLLVISFIRFCILPVVLSIFSTWNSAKVLSTRAENSSKFSCLIWWVIVSSVSFSRIRLKIFLKRIHIWWSSWDCKYFATNRIAFLLFWIGSPSCKNNLFRGFILSLNAFRKSFSTILAKLSPLSYPKYWVNFTKSFLYDIPTRKLADHPPVLSFFPFPVWLNPSRRSLLALLLQWRASSRGLCF